MTVLCYHSRPDGLRLAYRLHAPDGASNQPSIVFLPGYMSDMAGSKATALMDACIARGQPCLLLDYAGCGASDGDFADGTLISWRDDALHLIEALVPGPVLLIGSSMGGWLMLLIALELTARHGQDRLAGMIGIAAAPDFTEWGFTDAEKDRLRREGRIEEPSDYSDTPYLTTLAFWESGQANLLLDKTIALDCPVRLLQGQHDADVPWQTELRLADALRSADVQVLLVKDGDHRLSRPADIALLLSMVDQMSAGPAQDNTPS